MEKISIIVPVYNSEKWLKRCLESIINQTYKNIEIIIINDGSTDNSEEICKEYSIKDQRIRIFNKKNTGVSNTRNYGIHISNGEYIQFVDSDDWLENDTCEKLLEYMKENNADLSVCGFNIYSNNTIIRKPVLPYRILNIREKQDDLIFLDKILNSPCNKLYKRRLITDLFNEGLSLGEDLIFNLNYIGNSSKTVTIEKCLYNVCLDNNNSLNRVKNTNRIFNLINLNEMEWKIYKSFYEDKFNEDIIFRRVIANIAVNLINCIDKLTKDEALQYIKRILDQEFVCYIIKLYKPKELKYKVFKKILSIKNHNIIYIIINIIISLRKWMKK